MPSSEQATTIVASAAAGAAAALALSKLFASLSGNGAVKKLANNTPHNKVLKVNDLTQSPPLVHGTMLLCTQNLAVSGANQVLLNLVEGAVWKGNIVLLSPSSGPFAKEFMELGVAVRIGDLDQLLKHIRDVRVAICNTIMTAHNVVSLDRVGVPAMWILHEWWPGQMLVDELTKRNDKNTTPEIVADALKKCKRTVCVCNNQLNLYQPEHGEAVFVGVPDPAVGWKLGAPPPEKRPITFLTLGIVCPRKNQHWAVETFLRWAGSRTDVRLLVVGARYIRQYEIDYVEKVKQTIGGDKRIELHDVTSNVDEFYRQADVLLFTSLNEVTPMVIAESMMRAIPVITTDIAGIPEMLTNGVHGYALPPGEHDQFKDALDALGGADAAGQRRRLQMAAAAKKHAMKTFTNAGMVSQYRQIALELASPIILLDMDGCVVDWDQGFRKAWGSRSAVDRAISYSMQKCVPAHLHDEAVKLYHSEGFFLNLPPMKGAIEAVKEMAAKGYRVFFCTSPVLTSHHCAGDKFEWVRKHFGQEWVQRIIITSDKTAVRGDVLIDDKPKITGTNLPTWRHLMFDAPYNMSETPPMRMNDWTQWEKAITALLSGAADKADEEEGADEKDKDKDKEVTPEVVAQLPDFSHLLPQDYRKDYLAWRSGQAKGAKGEIEDALTRMEAMQDSLANNTSEDFSEVTLYRKGYAQWRRGKSKGAKGDAVILGHLEGGAKSKKA